MPVSISGDGTFAGLTSVETVDLRHPDAVDSNIVLADDGSIALDSIPASIQSAINGAVLAGIGSNVVQTVKTDTFTTTSSTYTSVTGLSATITPTTSLSKILVIANFALTNATSTGNGSHARIVRGSTGLYQGTAAGSRIGSGFSTGGIADNRAQFGTTLVFLDAPGVATATTYAVQIRIGTGTACIGRGGLDDDQNNSGRSASSITLIEVAA